MCFDSEHILDDAPCKNDEISRDEYRKIDVFSCYFALCFDSERLSTDAQKSKL